MSDFQYIKKMMRVRRGLEAARREGPRGRGFWGPRGGQSREWLGDVMGPPSRAGRGEVRYLVLDAIAASPRHGYEVIQAIEERTGGTYRPSPGVVYPTLTMLEELRHARGEDQEGRKTYAITDEGRTDLAEHRHEVEEFYARFESASDEAQEQHFAELMRHTARLFKSFKRAAHHGHISPEKKQQIKAILDDALQRIDACLAQR